jgi:ATP-dependent HslUV protease, peptidase subunit HslV
MHGTTVLCVRRGERVCLASDGQVTLDRTVMKATARKVRRLADGRVLAGFAGGTADALTLFELFEKKLSAHGSSLPRAAVELAKDWRTDRMLRRLEALLLVADREHTLVLSGSGDVVEPDPTPGPPPGRRGRPSRWPPRRVAEEAMRLAGEICIYTNQHLSLEELE